MQISVTPNGNQSHIQYLHKMCQNAYLVHILVILAPKKCFVTDGRANIERQIGLLGWGGSGGGGTMLAMHFGCQLNFRAMKNLKVFPLKTKDCQFDHFVVTSTTVICHYANLRYHQWQQGCIIDEFLFSHCNPTNLKISLICYNVEIAHWNATRHFFKVKFCWFERAFSLNQRHTKLVLDTLIFNGPVFVSVWNEKLFLSAILNFPYDVIKDQNMTVNTYSREGNPPDTLLKACKNVRHFADGHTELHHDTLRARFMGPTWGQPGADRTQVGPMLATRTLLSG